MYKIGESITNRYLVKNIFQGGMGIVYVCLDQEKGEVIALKTIKDQFLTSLTRWEKFVNEIQTWINIGNHPNIVHAKKLEQVEGNFYIFMEYVPSPPEIGSSLRGWILKKKTNLEFSINTMIQICDGLIYAQNKVPGLVHRDLKPENILITLDKIAKITDFGLVQNAFNKIEINTHLIVDLPQNPFHPFFTIYGDVAGTPAYMSPEQTNGENLDVRSDIYSIGCVLYELVTGKWLTNSTTSSEWFTFQRTGKPILPSKHCSVPRDLELVILKCLEKQKESRYQSFEELLVDLSKSFKKNSNKIYEPKKKNNSFSEEDAISKARSLIEIGDNIRAMEVFSLLLKKDANSIRAMIGLASSLIGIGKYDDAIKYCEKAYLLSESVELKAKALSNKGLALLIQKKYQLAIDVFNQAILIMPELMHNWNNLGIAYELTGEVFKSLEFYEKTINLDPWSKTGWSNKARVLMSLGKKEEAQFCFEQSLLYSLTIVDKISASLQLWNNPKFIATYINDIDFMKRALDFIGVHGLELDKLFQNENPANEFFIACTSRNFSNFFESRNDFLVFIKNLLKVNLAGNKMKYLSKQTNQNKFRESLNDLSLTVSMIESHSNYSDNVNKEFRNMLLGVINVMFATNMMFLEKFDSATELIQKAINLGLQTPFLYAIYSTCLFSINNWGESLYYINKALEHNQVYPNSYEFIPELWIIKGQIISSKGDIESAIICFDNALAIDPKNIEAYQLKKKSIYQLQLKNQLKSNQ
jgi:serine/threonine protein kinase